VKELGLLVRGLVAAASLGVVACYPLTYDDAAEVDMVVTRKAPDYDYSRNRTYAIPDTVVDLCTIEDIPVGEGGAGGEGSVDVSDVTDCVEVSHVYDQQILDAISRNMERLGYVRVAEDATDPPDVIVSVGTIASNNWVAYTYYPYWGYYPGYWWPYYGGWYGYYPYYPATTVVNYPTGTIFMQLMSLKDADPVNERIPGIWTAAVRVLLETSDEATASSRINTNIDQAFAQSPYLKVTP
jgi:hypothetical protein